MNPRVVVLEPSAKRSPAAMRTIPVIELFHSIQGEGTRIGEPATFMRFAGCNLRCTWCDTPYSWSAEGVRRAERPTLADIAGRVREKSVVLTGGEPMLHRRVLGDLITELRAGGVDHVTVETNATIYDASLAPRVDLWSLSPKLPGSGERADASVIRRFLASAGERCQLKFVIADLDADWPAMWHLLDEVVDEVTPLPQVLVQPDGLRHDYGDALRELSELVLADNERFGGVLRRSLVRVLPQAHRIAWGPSARGV